MAIGTVCGALANMNYGYCFRRDKIIRGKLSGHGDWLMVIQNETERLVLEKERVAQSSEEALFKARIWLNNTIDGQLRWAKDCIERAEHWKIKLDILGARGYEDK